MRLHFALVLMLAAAPAMANDTTAELGTGGLIFTRSDTVEMQSEDLFISRDQVRVAYQFRNRSDNDVDSIVAFPMPDIQASPYDNVAIPDAKDNFLDFTVTADGKAIEPKLDQRAFAGGIDVTDDLKTNGVALFPYDEGNDARLSALSDAVKADWVARGIVVIDTYDAGEGMKDHYAPTWTLKSTYWWRMTFPKDKQIDVRHTYTPSVGGTVAAAIVEDGKVGGPMLANYRTKYCVDQTFEKAVQKAADAHDGMPPYTESWISYILTTGGNWRGTIKDFKLTIDKGEPDALVSFCGSNVKKTGPTTFEMRAADFYPEDDLHVLILTKHSDPQ